MSIGGYLVPRDLTVRKRGGKRALVPGAVGPVLAGEMSPMEKLGQDSVEATVPGELFGMEIFRRRKRCKGGEEFYASVDRYDPVLAWHCGFKTPGEGGEG